MLPKKLFISYAHHDEAWCTDFVDMLKRRGLSVWFDRYELGNTIEDTTDLQRALAVALDSSDLFVMLYSAVSRNSPWVAWELMHRPDCRRIIVLRAAPVDMIGAYVRSLANCGVYDAGHLSGTSAAEALIPHLGNLELIPDDILQGLWKADSRAAGLWQLYAYKSLTNNQSHKT